MEEDAGSEVEQRRVPRGPNRRAGAGYADGGGKSGNRAATYARARGAARGRRTARNTARRGAAPSLDPAVTGLYLGPAPNK